METIRYSLDTRENNKIVSIIRIVFGVVCLGVAIFWIRFNINSLRSDGMLWITIVFLAGFGIFQIFTGFGKTSRYIEIGLKKLVIRNKSILPLVELSSDEITKIEFFPLNVVFFLKSGRRILLRFGTTYHETNEKIVNEINNFSERNNIPVEIIDEKI
jgi:hypothetical protein